MKRPAWKAFVVLIGAAMVLIAGCAGQRASSDVKQSRTLAAENIELKKQLHQCKEELETLKARHAEEINNQKQLLETCQRDQEIWKQKAQQNIREQAQSVLKAVMEDNTRLREENNELKTQIEQLQKEAEQNKDPNK